MFAYTIVPRFATRLCMATLAALLSALLAGVSDALAQGAPQCVDANDNPIDCATLPGDLGQLEGASVDCGKNPYLWNPYVGGYEREFNKFCAGLTNDTAEILFHGMTVLQAQQASQAAGYSGIAEAVGSGATSPIGPDSTGSNGGEGRPGGPTELREGQAYQAAITLELTKETLRSQQAGLSESEVESTYEGLAGIFRFALLGLRQAQHGQSQLTQSF